MLRTGLSLAVAGMVVLGSCGTAGPAHEAAKPAAQAGASMKAPSSPVPLTVSANRHRRSHRRGSGRLDGKVVVIDPGHQLGNSRHLHQIDRLVNAGGFMKACNTTGTATDGGYPEATFNWRVAQALKRQLRSRGATVYLTRHTNSYADWGPCIDTRGRKGNKVHADVAISIHGDGAASDVRGFFVITPSDRKGWTSDIYRVSRHFALNVRSGLVRAGVRASNAYGGDGLDVRGDLGTLNWSNVPIVMVELANMRNATDARHITSAHYRRHGFARGLRIGIVRFLLHH
jgi:N-acetylmuramoyl-L-alanine amidase